MPIKIRLHALFKSRIPAILGLGFLVASCTTSNISVKLDPAEGATLRQGHTLTVQVIGKTSDYDPAADSYDWSSANTNIAVVSNNGGSSTIVVGISNGVVAITAKSRKYSSVVPVTKIEVLAPTTVFLPLSMGGGYGGGTNVSLATNRDMIIFGGLTWYYSSYTYYVSIPQTGSYQISKLKDTLAGTYRAIITNSAKTNTITTGGVITNIAAGHVLQVTATGVSLGDATDTNAYRFEIRKL